MRTLLLILGMVLPAMAGREFVSGSSQLGVGAIDPISPPLTISVTTWPRQNTAALALVSVGTTTNASERVQLAAAGSVGGDPWRLTAVDSTASGFDTDGTTAFPTNRWQHVAAVVGSATSRILYVDGAAEATGTASVTVNGLNQVCLGARKNTSYGLHWTGGIAEVAVWSVALTANEIASLADGMSPLLIRPTSRVFYTPLTGQESITEWNYDGAPLSLTNSPAPGTSHPRIYRP